MKNVIAIIPARSGSKSILNKNIALLSGFPLIAYSIVAAQLSKKIDRIVVSSDSEEYTELSSLYGAEIPFLRPSELSSDDSTDRDFMIHAMQWFHDNEAFVPEYWVHLRPTTPLRDPGIIDQAIDEIIARTEATSLRSGHLCPESPLKWFIRDKNGYFQGLMQDVKDKEYYNRPKEAFDSVYIPDGYVDIVRASHVLTEETLHGDCMIGFESPVCTEVDSEEELEYLNYQVATRNPLVYEILSSKYKEYKK